MLKDRVKDSQVKFKVRFRIKINISIQGKLGSE